MGWVSSNGMGSSPLSFTEINAYVQCTGFNLDKDEVILIKKISKAFLNGLNDTSPSSEIPYNPL